MSIPAIIMLCWCCVSLTLNLCFHKHQDAAHTPHFGAALFKWALLFTILAAGGFFK